LEEAYFGFSDSFRQANWLFNAKEDWLASQSSFALIKMGLY